MLENVQKLFVSDPYYYTYGPHRSQVSVESGSAVRIDCADCDNRTTSGELPQERRHKPDGVYAANPVAGPVAVIGAEVGDSIAVDVLSIDLSKTIGRTGLGPGHGLLPAHLVDPNGDVPRHLYQWEIDPSTWQASLLNPLGSQPIKMELRPFIGCVGVSPEYAQTVSTLFAGNHGGNIDLPSVRTGATIYLPVFVREALVMVGDIHAAQGHGEAIGGAIETPGQVEIRVRLCKGRAIPAPRIRNAEEIGAVATDGDLRRAIQTSYSRLIQWMADELEMNRFDAYNLLSQVARVELGNLVNSPFTVATFLPEKVLPPEARRLLEAQR